MPFIFILAFFFLYLLLVIRSEFAATIGIKISKCMKLKYKKPQESDDDSDEDDLEKSSKITFKLIKYVKTIIRMIINNIIWVRNIIVWGIREKTTALELRRLFNKVIGASLSFIVFFYLRIMTTSFQIFGCDYQPNGIYTLKESPDIVCFQGVWFVFLPLSILSIILFGVGAMIYYGILIINYKRWEKSETFILINRFSLKKYKKKFFYWQFFDSFRKLAFSLLTVFFKPMFLITIGIAIIFSGMMLNVHFIPYRKKFHNVMHYFVLMSTLMTLFAGLLLFVVDNNARAEVVIDPGLKNFLSFVLPVITVILIIGSNIIVISMFVYDLYIRRKKQKKRTKLEKKLKAEELEKEEKLSNVLDELHGMHMDNKSFVPWETEHDFQFTVNFVENPEKEDESKSMNDILNNIFSFKRAKKKGFLITRAGKRAKSKILNKKMSSKRIMMKDDTSVFKKRMENGFQIKSDFQGEIAFISRSKTIIQRHPITTELNEENEEIQNEIRSEFE